MRLSVPASLIGSLGSLAQIAINAVNYLRVQLQGRGDGETDSNNAFVFVAAQAGAAANNSHVQLKNPAASGKTVYVDEITYLGNGTAQSVNVSFYDTDLTTDVGAGASRADGGASSTAHLRSQNNGALLGTQIDGINAQASVPWVFTYNPPLKLAAGRGVLLAGGTQNLTMGASFKYREY